MSYAWLVPAESMTARPHYSTFRRARCVNRCFPPAGVQQGRDRESLHGRHFGDSGPPHFAFLSRCVGLRYDLSSMVVGVRWLIAVVCNGRVRAAMSKS
jgi:hypothetical protein